MSASIFDLLDHQKNLLRQVVALSQEGRIGETFEIMVTGENDCEIFLRGVDDKGNPVRATLREGKERNFEALIEVKCLQRISTAKPSWQGWREYALTGRGFRAVQANFADDSSPTAATYNTSFHAPVNAAQIGSHNRQEVHHVIQTLQSLIQESSSGTPEQKAEVESMFTRFLKHPATNAVLGGIVSGLVGELPKQ